VAHLGLWDSFKEAIGFRSKKVEEASASARDPKKTAIKKLGQAITSGGSGGGFEESPVDLEEVQRAYHTDSYIRRAVDKYAGLMLKNGWDFNGKNEAAVEYVWTRFKLMAEGTGKPIDQLLSQLAFDFVLYGNAYLVKARAKGSQAGATGVNAVGYTGKQPIAGYFILPATTVQVERDETGNITGYQQDTGGGNALTFAPTEVIHFVYRQPTGRAYGVPMVFNVLDDVQILRQLEENVARLVYRNLFPLYLYQVGLDKPGFEATDEEIEEIREQIRDMPMDGGIVVPERHNIKVIGAEGNAIDAEPYLLYYRQRVFTGLGVSDTVMGIGGTANRSTSDNQAADLFDGVKEFQRLFAEQFQQHIVNEILFEGGFDPTLNPDDEVKFFFDEIELDAKTKRENHVVQLFTQNVITHEEMRAMLGLDPVTDEGRLYFNMVTVGTAAATAQFTQTADTSGQEAANNAGSNKDQPSNQHGTKSSPGKPKASDEPNKVSISEKVDEKVLTESDVMVNLTTELPINSYVESMNKFWTNLTEDVSQMMKAGKTLDQIRGFAVEIVRQSLRGQNRQYISSAMMKGIYSGREELNKPGQVSLSTTFAVEQIVAKGERYVNRLLDDLTHLLAQAYKEEKLEDRVAKAIGAFNSNKYRLTFIANTELYRAYNYGKAVAAKEAGLETVDVVHHEGCDQCKEKQGQVVLTDMDLIDAVPPHHPNCTCLVQLNMPAEEV
jgi:SPP1 gp7 family putative phage head morphogenesis protein